MKSKWYMVDCSLEVTLETADKQQGEYVAEAIETLISLSGDRIEERMYSVDTVNPILWGEEAVEVLFDIALVINRMGPGMAETFGRGFMLEIEDMLETAGISTLNIDGQIMGVNEIEEKDVPEPERPYYMYNDKKVWYQLKGEK